MYFRRMLALIRILFMKKNLKYTLPALALIAALAAGFSWKAPSDDQEKVVMLLVHDALAGVHYQPKPIDDAFSQEVMDVLPRVLGCRKTLFAAVGHGPNAGLPKPIGRCAEERRPDLLST